MYRNIHITQYYIFFYICRYIEYNIYIQLYIRIYMYIEKDIYLLHESIYPNISPTSICFLIATKLSCLLWQAPPAPSSLEKERKKLWAPRRNGIEGREGVCFYKKRSYITTCEKRLTTGRLITEAGQLHSTPLLLYLQAWYEFRYLKAE